MTQEEFERLVANIRTDGRLTSTILVCQEPDGALEILSGHHRTLAAIEVGLDEVDALVITTPIDEERKTAIQLSHNSVAGDDNPATIAEMYRRLGLDARMFSGLTDEVLDFDKLTIGGLSVGMKYEELRFTFLETDRNTFETYLNRIKISKKLPAVHLARYEDFDQVFAAVLQVKERKGIINSALAVLVMAELALERLAQIEAETEDGVAAA